jgi:type VI secretion system VasD/TssJ family lipoprotein
MWLAGCLLLLAAGCAAPGSSLPLRGSSRLPQLAVTVRGTAQLNNCGRSTAFQLEFRVVQLKAQPNLQGVSAKQLWTQGSDVLRDILIPARPYKASTVDPDTTALLTDDLAPETQSILVYGSFCKASPDSYFVLVNRKPGAGVILHVTAAGSSLRISG